MLRHIPTGKIGLVRSSGHDTDGLHVTAIEVDGEILNAPSTEFETAAPVAQAGEDGSADAIRAASPSPAATPKRKITPRK